MYDAIYMKFKNKQSKYMVMVATDLVFFGLGLFSGRGPKQDFWDSENVLSGYHTYVKIQQDIYLILVHFTTDKLYIKAKV